MKIILFFIIIVIGILAFYPKSRCLIFGHKQYYPTFAECINYKPGDTFKCIRCSKVLFTITDIKGLTRRHK